MVTMYPTAITVCCEIPRTASPANTSTQHPSNTTTGTTSCRSLTHQGVSDRADANPPTKKNNPSVCNTQVSGTSPGIHRNGLSTLNPSPPCTNAVTNQ
ncbi:hypothetical protein Lesp02_21400 [Lentzea sp. NBRC 105346]|nr:hypothetical protein Lesp02_21400 [Lentzea sp. NBRC 105346]